MSENRAVHVGGNISTYKELQLESVKGTHSAKRDCWGRWMDKKDKGHSQSLEQGSNCS